MFDYIWDLLPTDPKELEQLLESKCIYIPYVPLLITKIEINDDEKEDK